MRILTHKQVVPKWYVWTIWFTSYLFQIFLKQYFISFHTGTYICYFLLCTGALHSILLNLLAHVPINSILELAEFRHSHENEIRIYDWFLSSWLHKVGIQWKCKESLPSSCFLGWLDNFLQSEFITVVPPYLRGTHPKTPGGCLILWIIPNIHTMFFPIVTHLW